MSLTDDKGGLSNGAYRWLMTARGVMDVAPPMELRKKKLAEQIDPELFYPPCYQLTKEGRDLQKALRVEQALKKDPA